MVLHELTRYQRTVSRALVLFFSQQEREVRRQTPSLVPFVREAAQFVERPGSKRLRGFLVTVGYQLAGKKPTPALTNLSVVAELAHASLLIHDDIIDQDVRRRGGPALHVALRHLSVRDTGRDHSGESQAILLGNFLAIWARELLLDSSWPQAQKLAALRVFERMMDSTHLGQMLDVALSEHASATRHDITRVQTLKTAIYSMEAPLQFGAALAGATPAMLSTISAIARPVGVAYQIQDDILGLFGNPRETGKAVGADLAEGKKTLLIFDALKRTRGREHAMLKAAVAKRSADKKTVGFVQHVVRSSGALAASEQRAQTLLAQGLNHLSAARQLDPKGSTMLRNLATAMLLRSR